VLQRGAMSITQFTPAQREVFSTFTAPGETPMAPNLINRVCQAAGRIAWHVCPPHKAVWQKLSVTRQSRAYSNKYLRINITVAAN
jgi:hypothetical protein